MGEYAGRLANGQDTAERMRRFDALGLAPGGVGLARPGLRPDGGGAVSVLAGTMTVRVQPFSGWVDGGVNDAQGGYPFVLDAAKDLTINPGHASLARTDVVVAEVRDNVYDASGATDARVRIVEGIPGGGEPALPTTCLPLRNITVPAGASAGSGGLTGGNLGTDRRTYTTGLGGIITVASQAERDALPAINGTEVYRTDLDRLQVRTASGWRDVVHGDLGAWKAYTPVWSTTGAAPTLGNATLTGRFSEIGMTVHFWMRFQYGSTSNAGSGVFQFSLPVPAREAQHGILLGGRMEDSGVSAYGVKAGWLNTATVFTVIYDNSPFAGAGAPFAWSANDFIDVHGTYEKA